MELRQRVIEAATKSFAMFGYKGTTMDQVAKIANVGKGTIYTFFDSKESLFTLILNNLIEDLKQIAESTIDPRRTFFENLEETLHKILKYRSEHELFVKLVQEVREIGTAATSEGLTYVEQAIVQYIAKQIRDGQHNGDVEECNPEVAAFIMLRTYTSLVMDWGTTRQPLSDEDIRQTFHQVFAKGLDSSASKGG